MNSTQRRAVQIFEGCERAANCYREMLAVARKHDNEMGVEMMTRLVDEYEYEADYLLNQCVYLGVTPEMLEAANG